VLTWMQEHPHVGGAPAVNTTGPSAHHYPVILFFDVILSDRIICILVPKDHRIPVYRVFP
jgi:hypothetical protein